MIGYNSYTINTSGYMVQYPNTETITAPSVIKQNATITHTGGIAETKIFSQLIPAGTFQANDILYWYAMLGAPSNANSKIFKAYFNDTDDITSSPVQIGTLTVTTNSLTVSMDRNLIFKNSLSSQEIIHSTTNFGNYLNPSVNAPTALSVDFTINQYFCISAALANAADSAYIYGIKSLISR